MAVRSDGEMTRARSVAAGLHVVLEGGWQGLNYRTVAAKLSDVTWQTVKHHYKTRPQLIGAVRDHMQTCIARDSQFRRQHPEKVEKVVERLTELEEISAV